MNHTAITPPASRPGGQLAPAFWHRSHWGCAEHSTGTAAWVSAAEATTATTRPIVGR